MDLMPVTVYTIVQSDKLHGMYRAKGAGQFKEGKAWVAATAHLAEARATGAILPIVFAAAERTRELLYQATISAISPTTEAGWRTVVTIKDLRPFSKPRPKKTELRVLSTGRYIPENHIRPYVLCHTPSFVGGPASNE